jgi:hypothetical protein
MPGRTGCKPITRAGAIAPHIRGPVVARAGYLAAASGLINIPKLRVDHRGEKISFGASSLTALAASLVEIGIADEADWAAAKRSPSGLVNLVLRRFLADHGQTIVAEHFELFLTLGESIIDRVYGERDDISADQLFFVLNTESSFPLRIGQTIDRLESLQPGMGQAFYDSVGQSLYRWVHVYDDGDARDRIEQMKEWVEEGDDEESYEIPKLEVDLPACLRDRKFTDSSRALGTFSLPDGGALKRVVELALELESVSHSVGRPKLDEDLLQELRDRHSLDLPLPAIVLYFRQGDAVTACFDNECEFWGQETPEPNLIVSLSPCDPSSVREALRVIETLLRVLVLTVEIKKLAESEEGSICASASMSEGNSN